MCLKTRNFKCNIADEDILCFKVLEFSQACGYMTPCIHSYVAQDILNGIKNMVALGEEEYNSHSTFMEINGGFIHTFKCVEDAIVFCDYNDLFSNGAFHIFKCIIPKGTRYYDGTCFCYGVMDSYASKEIKYLEKLDFTEEE